jgi:hypothetical protein
MTSLPLTTIWEECQARIRAIPEAQITTAAIRAAVGTTPHLPKGFWTIVNKIDRERPDVKAWMREQIAQSVYILPSIGK